MAVEPNRSNPDARPTPAFNEFRAELNRGSPFVSYGFSEMKAQSCDWMIDRIAAGAIGVDIGGTEYLCERLAEKGCDVTYYDFGAPRAFPKAIEDDMFNVLDHFSNRSLDFITTRHTLEHALVPLFQLWAYNRMLRDDGHLFVIVPQYNTKWLWFHTHFSCLPVDGWRMLFYRAGFRVVDSATEPWHPTYKAYIENRFELAVESREMRLENVSPKSDLARIGRGKYFEQSGILAGRQATQIVAAERQKSVTRVKQLKRKMRFWDIHNWPFYVRFLRRKIGV